MIVPFHGIQPLGAHVFMNQDGDSSTYIGLSSWFSRSNIPETVHAEDSGITPAGVGTSGELLDNVLWSSPYTAGSHFNRT